MEKIFIVNSTVIGYHGCVTSVKNDLLENTTTFRGSNNLYDWLGQGVYFWENDLERAMSWENKGDAIGAEINLGTCLDLSQKLHRDFLALMYQGFIEDTKRTGIPIPENKNPKGYKGDLNDKVLRYLDCAVIKYACSQVNIEYNFNFDSIRAPFQEGHPLYKGSSFRENDHIHLCVRNINQIKLFDPMAK